MKKKLAMLLAVVMVVGSLAGCGSSSSSDSSDSDTTAADSSSTDSSTSDSSTSDSSTTDSSDDTTESAYDFEDSYDITDLVLYAESSKEASTLLLIHSETGSESFCSNFTDGWLTNNSDGTLAYLLADWYETTDEGYTWVFHLREDVVATWVDYQGNYKADVTVQDWVTSAEYVLNYWKNGGNNANMLTECLEGAEEYYEYTKSLSEEEAKALDISVFEEMVGVEADEEANTVTYTCFQQTAYFYTLAVHKVLQPLCAEAVEEAGLDDYNAVTYDQLWYCGPYTLTSFISGNEKVLTKNEAYWNYDNVILFDTVTIKMVDSLETAYQLYLTGEIDYVELNESTLYTILNDEDSEYYDYLVKAVNKQPSTTLYFNFAKNNEDGTEDVNWNTAAANEAFRLSLYYGIDWTSYLERYDPVNPYSIASYTITHAQVVYTEDGTDYRSLVLENLGIDESVTDENQRLDSDLAETYKEQAIEELTAQGVTFPIEIDYYIASGSQTDLDNANVLKQCIEDSLGTDYVTVNILTYISSATSEVYTPSLQSIALSAWGQDFGDPINSVGQLVMDDDSAVFSARYTHINDADEDSDIVALMEEFTEMVDEAADLYEVDDRLEAFAECEAYLMEHAVCIPVYLDVAYQLTKINNYTMSQAGFGSQGSRYVNIQTDSDGYTTEEWAAFAEARLLGEY